MNSCKKIQNDETKDKHILVERELLKSMQEDIISATKMISVLRDEKEKLKKLCKMIEKENNENKLRVKNLADKISQIEKDDILIEINQAQDRLKFEMQKSAVTSRKEPEINEINYLSEILVSKIRENPRGYSLFKSHLGSSSSFKKLIKSENWVKCTLSLLKLFLGNLNQSYHCSNVKTVQTDVSSDSEIDNYSKVIKDSQQLLNTISCQKSRLEHLGEQMSLKERKFQFKEPQFVNKQKVRPQTVQPFKHAIS